MPVELNVGSPPTTGLLKASRRVIKSTLPAVPFAVMPVLGEATNVEFAAVAGPARKATAPSAFTTGEVIVSVFVSATVELSVQFERPAAFVTEQVPYEFVPPVLVAVKVGVNPLSGMLSGFRTVIETCEFETPSAVIEVVPVIVEVAAFGEKSTKLTVPESPATRLGGLTVIVFISNVLDLIVATVTPAELVGAAGWVMVVPVPFAENAMENPGTGFE